MTFTPETPTEPGDYAWKLDPDSLWYELRRVGVCGFEGVSYLGELEHGKPISSLGGLWCRLVPADEYEVMKQRAEELHARVNDLASNLEIAHIHAKEAVPKEEVEKAFHEGADTLLISWDESRAKRVVEGRE